MRYRLLRPTVPVTFHYSADQSETDADGFEIGATSAVINRMCIVDTAGSRESGEVDRSALDSWDAEIAWVDMEGETSTEDMKLQYVVVDGLTLYPTSELPHALGVGGFRLGTDRVRQVRVSRTERGRV